MGGHALQLLNITTERKTTPEFFKIYTEVVLPFHKIGFETHLVKFYREKSTHGDIDILIMTQPNRNIFDLIKEYIPTKGITKNGNVISFEYNNFQIDFICVSPSHWETSVDFFDYDPTGNLMGKIAHKFGLIYGFEGLLYKFRSTTSHFSEDIIISTDSAKIFNFLGYSYSEYCRGFETLNDIFHYIIFGKYFNKSIFQLEELSSVDRKRNRKRDTYNAFIKYVGLLDFLDVKKDYTFEKDKSKYIEFINSSFPNSHLIDKINVLKEKERIFNEMKLKFNGNLIMEKYPELTGKELGYVLTHFKDSYSNFDEFILNNTQEEIFNQFKIFYHGTN
jgi:hypothetical protein